MIPINIIFDFSIFKIPECCQLISFSCELSQDRKNFGHLIPTLWAGIQRGRFCQTASLALRIIFFLKPVPVIRDTNHGNEDTEFSIC
ncbi:Uncharacterized protein dnm_053710 [Desulfonema magnum]|uniref:Uncharacterized protein n=1 Tax=Desulfonema magnum TaxID=45655 RepID=A0A975GPS6_9BACT|nr:Uncharacterized protein dnm_053710 [Desulfonema magnum]